MYQEVSGAHPETVRLGLQSEEWTGFGTPERRAHTL